MFTSKGLYRNLLHLSKIVLFLGIFIDVSCSPIALNNPNDPKSKSFMETLALKCLSLQINCFASLNDSSEAFSIVSQDAFRLTNNILYDMNVVTLGQSVHRKFTISNISANTMNIGNLSISGNRYSVILPSETNLSPGSSVIFTVIYSASLTTSETGILTISITSYPDFIVNLTGVGINTPSNLVYHNPLDGNAATLVGPAGILVGATATADKNATANKALAFDGTSSTYINTQFNFDPGVVSTTRTPFSFLLWYKSGGPTTTPSGSVFDTLFGAGFIAPPGATANGCWAYFYRIERQSDMISRFFYYDQSDAGTPPIIDITSSVINYNQWNHVGIISNIFYSYIYLNGKLVNTVANDTTLNYRSQNGLYLQIGGGCMGSGANTATGGIHWFYGSLDDFRIYDRALTSEEVFAIYNQY